MLINSTICPSLVIKLQRPVSSDRQYAHVYVPIAGSLWGWTKLNDTNIIRS